MINTTVTIGEIKGTASVYNLCDEFGIKIMECDLGEKVKGFYQKSLGCSIIHVNKNLNNNLKESFIKHQLEMNKDTL